MWYRNPAISETETDNMEKTKTARKSRAKQSDVSPLDTFITALRGVTVANVIAFVTSTIAGNTAVRNVGRLTGMRVMAFQNMTLIRNADWQLDDVQLAALWACEFPRNVGRVFAMNGIERPATASSVIDGITIVRGVRAEYNRNGHADANGKPAVESVSYGERRFVIPTVAVTVEPATKKTRKSKTA